MRSPHQVAALGQLYAAERSAGQDIAKLSFTVIGFLLAFVAASAGWVVSGRSLPPKTYLLVQAPVIGLTGYLIQLMLLTRARGTSIDYLEGQLCEEAVLSDPHPPIGSKAEKQVTDIAHAGVLGVALALVMYVAALFTSFAWVCYCSWNYLLSPSRDWLGMSILVVEILLTAINGMMVFVVLHRFMRDPSLETEGDAGRRADATQK